MRSIRFKSSTRWRYSLGITAAAVLVLGVLALTGSLGTPKGRSDVSASSDTPHRIDRSQSEESSSVGSPKGGSSSSAGDSGEGLSPTPGKTFEPYEFCFKRTEEARRDPKCASLPDEPPDRPYDSDPRIEKVSWTQLAQWWPYSPLLRDRTLAETGAQEIIFVASEDGGRRGDPTSERAGFTIFYEYPPNTSDRLGYTKILDGGGIAVRANFDPPGESYLPTHPRRPVIVRGRSAWLYELRKPQANVDWRRVIWNEGQSNDGTVQWEIGDNPTKRDESVFLKFINDLEESR